MMHNAYKLNTSHDLTSNMPFKNFKLDVIEKLIPPTTVLIPKLLCPATDETHIITKIEKRKETKRCFSKMLCMHFQQCTKDINCKTTIYICIQCPGEPTL